MGKNKLSKFADLETFSCVLQYPYARLETEGFPYKGSWRTKYFASPSSPLVIELGCGRLWHLQRATLGLSTWGSTAKERVCGQVQGWLIVQKCPMLPLCVPI